MFDLLKKKTFIAKKAMSPVIECLGGLAFRIGCYHLAIA